VENTVCVKAGEKRVFSMYTSDQEETDNDKVEPEMPSYEELQREKKEKKEEEDK
jgi:hypothetical protein